MTTVHPVVADAAQHLLAESDQYHAAHTARLLRTLELVYDAQPQGRLLELGSTGFIPLTCRKLFPDLEVVVTHHNTTLERRWPKTFTLADDSIEVMAYCLDLEFAPLPADDESFDMVLCCEVLEHMEIDPMYMLSEVNRVLKPGGRMLLTTPNILSSRALDKISRGIAPWFYMQYHKDRSYHRHNIEYDAHSLRKLLHAAGFTPKVWSEDLFEPGIPAAVERARAAGFDVTNVGDNLIALCEKTSPVVDRHPTWLYD